MYGFGSSGSVVAATGLAAGPKSIRRTAGRKNACCSEPGSRYGFGVADAAPPAFGPTSPVPLAPVASSTVTYDGPIPVGRRTPKSNAPVPSAITWKPASLG
jgi:hypothetical protein